MKIVDKRESKLRDISELKPGDCFTSVTNSICVVCTKPPELTFDAVWAVDLNDGRLMQWHLNTRVMPVQATVAIE